MAYPVPFLQQIVEWNSLFLNQGFPMDIGLTFYIQLVPAPMDETQMGQFTHCVLNEVWD